MYHDKDKKLMFIVEMETDTITVIVGLKIWAHVGTRARGLLWLAFHREKD